MLTACDRAGRRARSLKASGIPRRPFDAKFFCSDVLNLSFHLHSSSFSKMAETKKVKSPKDFAGVYASSLLLSPCSLSSHSRFHDGRCFCYMLALHQRSITFSLSSFRPSPRPALPPSSVSSSWFRTKMRWSVLLGTLSSRH